MGTESDGSSPFPPVMNTESGGSSPFSPVENQMGLLHFLLIDFDSWPIGYVGECSILSQSAISESATVHYFSLVRALSSLHLEVLNSPLIKPFIVWQDIGRSMHC
ncbi:unnamed protein product, partial [Rodentolepis nana]